MSKHYHLVSLKAIGFKICFGTASQFFQLLRIHRESVKRSKDLYFYQQMFCIIYQLILELFHPLVLIKRHGLITLSKRFLSMVNIEENIILITFQMLHYIKQIKT
jgi:hypothetical protein